MATRTLTVATAVAALSLTLTACGGSSEPESEASSTSQAGESASEGGAEPQEEAPGLDVPVEVGGTYTYPDGLEVSVGNWRVEEKATSGEPARAAYFDVTAANPTDEPVTTTQAWASVRAGETGETLEEWVSDDTSSVDAVLQPGAEVSASYMFTAPETPGHVVATVSWLEAEDPAMRYDVAFALTDDAEGQKVAAGPSETMPAPGPSEAPEIEGKSLSYEMLQYSWSPQAESQVCPEWEADPESVHSWMAGEYGTHKITAQDVDEFLADKC